MDILAEDLGTTEVIKLFGERLKTARAKNIELERGLAAKTIECNANLQRAQQSDQNRAALRQELHRVTLKVKEEAGTCTNPQHFLDISTKTRSVEELTEQLRVKSEAEKEHLEALAETQNALAIYKQKYKDAKSQLTEAAKRQIDEPVTSLGQMIDFVAKFASPARPNQLEEQFKRTFTDGALPLSPSDLQDHMAKESPSSQFHCFNEVVTQSGTHQWVVGSLHRIKYHVEQQHYKTAEWTPHSQYKQLHGKTIEVFRRHINGKTIYLGRHKAIPLKNLHSNQFLELPKGIRRSLVESVITHTGWTKIAGRDDVRGIISKLFNCGTIQIECLGLQFDAFDEKLNASMAELARQRALPDNTPGSLGQRQVKKRKIDEVGIARNEMETEYSSVKAASYFDASEREYGNRYWG